MSNSNPAEGPDKLITAERYDAAARQLHRHLTHEGLPQYEQGKHLLHTCRRTHAITICEFRGFHNHAEDGHKVARVIFRPLSGPPFETSVEIDDLRA